VKQDDAPTNWEDVKEEETLVANNINVPEARTEFQRTSNIQHSKKLMSLLQEGSNVLVLD
jgi:hypothetical protein